MLAITPGEPAGIGPDIAIELCQIEREEAIVLVADKNMFGVFGYSFLPNVQW